MKRRLKALLAFLFFGASLLAQRPTYVAGPARSAYVTDANESVYLVTWRPLYCGSQQANDCEARVANATRLASVLVVRLKLDAEGKVLAHERVDYDNRACVSDHCAKGKENLLDWIEAALVAEKERK
jgi:hypothetical protein